MQVSDHRCDPDADISNEEHRCADNVEHHCIYELLDIRVVRHDLVSLRQLQCSFPQLATSTLWDATPHVSMDNNASGSPVKKQEEMDDPKAANKDTKPTVRTLNRVPRTRSLVCFVTSD